MTSPSPRNCCCTLSRSKSITDNNELKDILPDSYDYNVCDFQTVEYGFVTRFRINIKNKETALKWLEEFSASSNSVFRVDKVFSENTVGNVYKVSKYCHHRSKHTKELTATSKNTNCTARIVLTVKKTELQRNQKSRDVHLEEFPTIVTLRHTHNHTLTSAFAFKYHNPNKEVLETYINMFKAGMTPAAAFHTFSKELQESHGDDYHTVSADRAINPDMKWVYNIYYKMFKKENGDACGHNMLLSLNNFIGRYNNEHDGACIRSEIHQDIPDQWYQPLKPTISDLTCTKENNVTVASDVLSTETAELLIEQSDNSKNSFQCAIEEFQSISKKIIETVENNNDMLEPLQKFIKNFNNIKTESALQSALATFGKYSGLSSTKRGKLCSLKRISVQPTAIARRKVKFGGRSCLQSGRPTKRAYISEHGYSVDRYSSLMRNFKRIAPRSSTTCVERNISLGKKTLKGLFLK